MTIIAEFDITLNDFEQIFKQQRKTSYLKEFQKNPKSVKKTQIKINCLMLYSNKEFLKNM